METFISIGDSRNSGGRCRGRGGQRCCLRLFPVRRKRRKSFDRCAERFSLDISFGAGSKFDGETTPANRRIVESGSFRCDAPSLFPPPEAQVIFPWGVSPHPARIALLSRRAMQVSPAGGSIGGSGGRLDSLIVSSSLIVRLGFAEWSWLRYFVSKRDGVETSPSTCASPRNGTTRATEMMHASAGPVRLRCSSFLLHILSNRRLHRKSGWHYGRNAEKRPSGPLNHAIQPCAHVRTMARIVLPAVEAHGEDRRLTPAVGVRQFRELREVGAGLRLRTSNQRNRPMSRSAISTAPHCGHAAAQVNSAPS